MLGLLAVRRTLRPLEQMARTSTGSRTEPRRVGSDPRERPGRRGGPARLRLQPHPGPAPAGGRVTTAVRRRCIPRAANSAHRGTGSTRAARPRTGRVAHDPGAPARSTSPSVSSTAWAGWFRSAAAGPARRGSRPAVRDRRCRAGDRRRRSPGATAGRPGDRDTIDVDVPPGLTVTADPDGLLQVVTNLLVNAVRHGGGEVGVAARHHGIGSSPSRSPTRVRHRPADAAARVRAVLPGSSGGPARPRRRDRPRPGHRQGSHRTHGRTHRGDSPPERRHDLHRRASGGRRHRSLRLPSSFLLAETLGRRLARVDACRRSSPAACRA